MEEKNIEIIKEVIREFLEKMGFSGQVETKIEKSDNLTKSEDVNSGENLTCNVNVEGDSNFLIGQYGVNLQALQHIARLIVRKKIEEKINFTLDINSYRQQKNQSVIEQAELAAKQAIDEKRVIVMKPMSPYERRLVHMVLGENNQVITESIGEGENRKVVVKPKDNIS